ncbi:hypothetical protein GCM10009837_50880 [Streptomyces durmitorensis]
MRGNRVGGWESSGAKRRHRTPRETELSRNKGNAPQGRAVQTGPRSPQGPVRFKA